MMIPLNTKVSLFSRAIGGTGKFKGIMGKGTYKGGPDASGNYIKRLMATKNFLLKTP